MFHLPGGNQLNLALNLPIVALVLHACGVVANGRSAVRCYLLVAGLGFRTVAVHGLFFALGEPRFLQPMSLALLAGTAVLSTAQVLALAFRPPGPSADTQRV